MRQFTQTFTQTFTLRATLRATLALLLTFTFVMAHAQSKSKTINIPLSRPGDPISLEIHITSAYIEIIGEDRDDAVFDVLIKDGKRKIITPSGPKSIANAGYALEVDEHDNKISLNTHAQHNRVSVVARIPMRADLNISTVNNGEIIVTNIKGNLELSNINGPITATRISGSVIAESINNTIDISFVSIDKINASSMESINGELNLRLPAKIGAQLHLDTSRGEIISDFEVEVLPSTPTVARNQKHGGVEVRIESVIIANINGGGPTVRLKSMNGNINILKAE